MQVLQVHPDALEFDQELQQQYEVQQKEAERQTTDCFEGTSVRG